MTADGKTDMTVPDFPAAAAPEHFGAVAIIGMAGRFPGAPDLAAFWRNLVEGRDSITRFEEPGKEAGFVGARGILADADLFDAEFFSVAPREAEQMDPQHRIFLELCQQALEDAGYDSHQYPGEIGLFGGCSLNTYLLANLCRDRDFLDQLTGSYQVGEFAAALGNDKDFLTTRAAYKLDLRGPVVTVQAACATSLVALCQAAQSLNNFECDMALAGGVSVTFPQQRGHLHQEGSLTSADGTCRPFDASATGTVFGHGAGVVVLKRYADALRDGDHVEALIRGYAVGNDGAGKAGYMAPGVDGQARVIRAAQAMAGCAPDTITYVEAHGTGTPLGDPIELAALTEVFRADTGRTGFCVVGSAKGNVGHLDAAAGVTGVIKTVLSLRHRTLPGLAHFKAPNPNLDLHASPFIFSGETGPWCSATGAPLRAGVSAFGVGGVNAHIILEQAPDRPKQPETRDQQVLCLSARSPAALRQAAHKLASCFESDPTIDLAESAYTLARGRPAYPWRLAVACSSPQQAAADLRKAAVPETPVETPAPEIVFLFPGQGSQFAGMGRDLYAAEPVFRDTIDRLAPVASEHLALDLRRFLLSNEQAGLNSTLIAQPALFLTSLATAELFRSWGISPQAMAGHSVGEFVAATLAGVMTPEQAISLVCQRASLMHALPPGAMVSVALDEASTGAYLTRHLEIAAANSPRSTVLAGSFAAIEQMEAALSRDGVASRRLLTSHAFHSAAMEPMLDCLEQAVAPLALQAPSKPYVSSVTGTWITPEQATSPRFWAEACRRPVRFRQALETLQAGKRKIFLEAGPGRALAALVRHFRGDRSLAVPVLTPETSPYAALATLWQAGAAPDWDGFFAHTSRRRVSLPTYPFERKRFWVEPPPASSIPESTGLLQTAPVPVPDFLPDSLPDAAPKSPAEALARLHGYQSEIAAILTQLSGIELSSADSEASFFELGFDSLFLTQATLSLSRHFATKITFRQLMEQFSSVAELARHLDQTLAPSPDPFAEQPASTPGEALQASVSPSGPSGLSGLLHQQIAELSTLFTTQIAALKAAAAGQLSPIPPVSPAPTSPGTLAPPPTSLSAPSAVRHGAFRPLQPKITQEITPQQQRFLDHLIAAYNARTPGSKSRTQSSRAHLADPRAVAGFRPQWKEIVYPILTDRAQGARLWDVDGNEYIDLVNGYGCILFGHSPDFVVQAAIVQLQRGVAIGPQSVLAGEVAEAICELTGNERVTFCNTGSEAVMAALRVARTVTGRDRFVYFGGDYHGTFDEVLLRPTPRGSAPIAPGIPTANTSNVTVLEYGAQGSLTWLREHAGELAAVLIEPVQTRNPALQPFDFIREVRQITEDAGSALILDEVVTGFRVAPGGMQEVLGLRADLCTYGKVLGGGHPIGVLSGKARFLDALDGGAWQYGDGSAPEVGVTFFAGTFVRHPLALAAARAVLTHLKQTGSSLQDGLNARAAALAESLDRFFVERGVGARVHHFCSWFYFTFPHESRLASLFYFAMRARGIHIQEGYPCFLTTAHTTADLEAIEHAFRTTILELQAAGILPSAESAPPEPRPEARLEPLFSAPLTEPQREILFAAGVSDAANCAFNEALTVTLHGAIRQDALLFALDAVFARHDALRSLVSEDGETLHFGDAFTGHTDIVDLRSSSLADQKEQVAKRIASEGGTPFDLQRGPLLRSILFLLAPEESQLLLVAHHLVLDGWSANQLLKEISAIYNQGASGLDLLAPLLPFSTYAAGQQRRRQQGDFAENERFWVGKFAGLNLLLALPLDRPRTATKSFAGATCTGALDPSLLPALKQFSAARGCSLYVTLLSSFQLLLHRLTGQEEVVVGISTAGQASLAMEAPSGYSQGYSLVGHCVQFLPMLSRLAADETADAHLRATRTAMLDAQEHGEFTLGTLIHALTEAGHLERHAGRLPLIEVQFNLEKIGDDADFDGLECRIAPCPKQFVNTDLFLNVVETAGALEYTCDFNRDLLDHETVARWMSLWEHLLRSELADSTQPARLLPTLPSAERHFLIDTFNQTAQDFGPFQSTPAMVLGMAAQYPARAAVTCAGQTWTYAELADFSTALARRLLAEGVRPGDLVGICLDRSLEMPAAMLAVMLAGAAYVPLDPRQPRARLGSIISDAGLALVLTGRDLILDTGARSLDITAPRPRHAAAALPDLSDITPESLSYVIYTSGSTGMPKGVAIPHSSLSNLLLSMRQQPGLAPEDVLVAVTTLAFDIAALEMFLPLITGASLVIATAPESTDGTLLLDLLRQSHATVLQATPGLWRVLLDAGWNEGLPLKALCGGEALPRELAEQILPRARELWNLYGPTETTIWSSATQVVTGTGPLRLGKPIANTQFYILDPERQLCPIGVSGELAIGGAGLARGYWKRPELTGSRFCKNPFHLEPDGQSDPDGQRDPNGQSRLYLTGDLARRLADGTIELLGRADFQVKVRGFRIELGDIECALTRSPLIREAVVLAETSASGSQVSLHGFFVPAPEASADVLANVLTDLRRQLTSTLPEYMHPQTLTAVEQMPRTLNGKLDRNALLSLALRSADQQPAFTAPATDLETRLATLWAEVLHLPAVSTTASIFELGADSLLIFRLAARAQREGIALKPALIFEHRTLAAICAQLAAASVATGTESRTSSGQQSSEISGPRRIAAVSRQGFRLQPPTSGRDSNG